MIDEITRDRAGDAQRDGDKQLSGECADMQRDEVRAGDIKKY